MALAALLCATGMNQVSAQAQIAAANGVGTPFELAFWQSIDSSGDPALYEAYLARFPNGTFGEIARAKIQVLRARLVPPVQTSVPAPMAPAAAVPSTVGGSLPVPVDAAPARPMPLPATAAPPSPASYAAASAQAPVAQVPAVPVPAAQAPVQQAIVQPAVAQVPTQDAPTAPAAQSATLGQLLAALANSQASGQPSAQHTAVASPGSEPVPPPVAHAAVSPGLSLPPQPALEPVPQVVLPTSFCSADARNAFHDTTYVTAVTIARRNNEAAVAYMKQLQGLYEQYQLSHDPETMNALAAAAHAYQPVTQTTFSTQAALVKQFDVLMAVPLLPCQALVAK